MNPNCQADLFIGNGDIIENAHIILIVKQQIIHLKIC